MVDNALIKYYRGLKRGKNLLNTNAHPEFKFEKKEVSLAESRDTHKLILTTPEGVYYVKKANKQEQDAEIFISQIYERLGLKSAIYLPAGVDKKYEYVVSNDVKSPNTIIARAHNVNMLKAANTYFPTDSPLYLPGDYDRISIDYSRFITRDGMRDLQLKRVVDCLCGDIDGHDLNFFYELNEDGLITRTISIDHSLSGIFYNDLFNVYQNEFSKNALSRTGMIRNIKENESLHSFITPNEIINYISNVDIPAIARDIKEDCGFKIDPKYVSAIDSSFNDMAEELIKG